MLSRHILHVTGRLILIRVSIQSSQLFCCFDILNLCLICLHLFQGCQPFPRSVFTICTVGRDCGCNSSYHYSSFSLSVSGGSVQVSGEKSCVSPHFTPAISGGLSNKTFIWETDRPSKLFDLSLCLHADWARMKVCGCWASPWREIFWTGKQKVDRRLSQQRFPSSTGFRC